MSSTDGTITTETAWPDKDLTPAQRENRLNAQALVVSKTGAIPMNFAQMVDYARYMSTARGAVGAHLMGNVGACLAVMEIANQFGMPPYAVARQSYLVNNRVCFMGQFFHSVIEENAPLKKGPNGRKLQWRYEGEGPTLKIIVSATFEGAAAPVEYESPMFKDITIKNSPLWKSPSPSEVKRQFVYFGVRGWQTIHWPEGMMQVMSDDEAAALPPSETARDITPEASGLRERLAQAKAEHPEGTERDGFKPGFTEGHFVEVAGDAAAPDPAKVAEEIDATLKAATPDAPAAEVKTEPAGDAPAEPKAKTTKKKKADDKMPAGAPVSADQGGRGADDPGIAVGPPKTAAEWVPYATARIDAEQDPAALRKWWQDGMKMRNDLGVTAEIRDPVFEHYQDRLAVLEGRS